MKDQATPPGPCLMENERINKEKILLSQSETKIENKYCQCKINILKIWYLGSCPQRSLNVLMNMNVPVENWDAFPC